MRVSDIKMGDWFEFGEGQGQISLIYGDTVIINGYQPNIAELQPIPLTKEILEKSGWHKSECMSVRGRARLYRLGSAIDKDETVVCFYAQDIFLEMWQEHNIVKKEIKYVHELQHLLWALGLDNDLKI